MRIKEDIINGQVAEVKLVYKSKIKSCDRLQVHNAHQMANIFRSLWNVDNIELLEESKVMYLNKANRVLAIYPLSIGGVSGTVIDVKLVLVAALRLHASQICIAHNHPSGNTTPSRADKYVTENISKAAELLNMNLLDHIILTKDNCYSMAEEGDL
ncbi:JAB domain-containing protein [Niabella ginsengisoli]|uniref:JAB domain-containing protein n=1 Tax=Niabella ginsengisoli TaxID=522298 RepID=A0ABS9SHZ9_9BACT|nr:JAB domain-containing protein [Niabella ginsengisoli]MCH5597997.1 JAB domain-containing protein [Niabella ginsengisoli]